MGAGGAGGRFDFGHPGIGFSKRDVFTDSAGEKHRVLQHDSDMRPETLESYRANVDAVDKYRTFRCVVEARNEIDNR